MAGNKGGPWGGGGGAGGDDDGRGNGHTGSDQGNGGRNKGEEGPQIPEIDELVKKGQEQLRVLMGGRSWWWWWPWRWRRWSSGFTTRFYSAWRCSCCCRVGFSRLSTLSSLRSSLLNYFLENFCP